MKSNEEKKKRASEGFSNFMDKSADLLNKGMKVGKKAAENAYAETKIAVEKMKETQEERKKERTEQRKAKIKEKLNPIFPKDYKSKKFNIPNVIKIVDDAERKGIELCEGAIGWMENVNKTEILFLYDEAKEISGLQFVPNFTCNAIYCVDPFDRTRFIKSDCIFGKAQEERLAELENIAYCLGAKTCSIEIVYSEESRVAQDGSFGLKAPKLGGLSAENQRMTQNGHSNSGKTKVNFEGHDHPIRPKLKWFAYDDTIQNLIEMRCTAPSSIKSRTLELAGSSSSTMTQQTAIAIDCLLKRAKAKMNAKMEQQSSKELASKLIFDIEF